MISLEIEAILLGIYMLVGMRIMELILIKRSVRVEITEENNIQY